ncbi:hypothetical protein M422DRAFT_223383 [Sphaerobolus stellatus SS14]|nr:hypothetical protein M422DRAFT_223383 [Sphaerobolus stellatus SS14]
MVQFELHQILEKWIARLLDHAKPFRVKNLGASFLGYEKLADLNESILKLQEAVDLTPDSHTDKIGHLSNLGVNFLHQFKYLNQLGDLEKAIANLQKALQLMPADHPDKAKDLFYLGNSFRHRFQHIGDLDDLFNAITLQQQAMELIPEGHTDKPLQLNNLGISFRTQFDHLGNLSDIDKAITLQRQAVALTPAGHADMPSLLNNLGISLHSQFTHLGNLSDIDEAMALQQQAVKLTPEGHADKPSLLNSLGNSFRRRFEHLGNLFDIDEAIALQQQAVELTPEGYADKPSLLNNLGNSFIRRFEHLGNLSDIDEAIALQQQAVELIPQGHADKPSFLSNLGSYFLTLFEHLGNISDIDEAIPLQQQAVKLTPEGNANKPSLLNNLGKSFIRRFEHLGNLSDINEAMALQQQAVELTPEGHANKPSRLNSLGNSFIRRFKHLGNLSDIDKAIALQQQAVDLTPDDHSHKTTFLYDLGKTLYHHFQALGQLDDMQSAITVFACGAQNDAGPPKARYQCAKWWGELATAFEPISSFKNPLPAWKILIDLIPQCACLGHKIAQRYEELLTIGQDINSAVACAISAGNLQLALEWLESGRNIVWRQILQLRTPIQELHDRYPEIANRLQTISLSLENSGIASSTPHFQAASSDHTTLEQEAQNHRSMTKEYQTLIDQIHQLPGFENFLQPKHLHQLTHAARNGPIVVINVHASRCDALILHSQDPSNPLLHVHLPDFSPGKAATLHFQLASALGNHVIHSERKPQLDEDSDNAGNLEVILKNLWSWVVLPIIAEISHLNNGEEILPHITWCATGHLAFLPLHAAGVYQSSKDFENISLLDFVVSSYTPTLTALTEGMAENGQQLATASKIVIVSQPNTPNQQSLPGTTKEAATVQKLTHAEGSFHLGDQEASVSAVAEAMAQYHWVYLACHGIQDPKDSLLSAFALYDEKLKLERLMHIKLDKVKLAFLSACQNATGDEKLSEEAVHIVAGMLAAGFPSVIGTLWSITDSDAPLVAEAFFSSLLRSGEFAERKNGQLRIAYALHEAVKKLREKVGVQNYERWVPFVHFGL